MKKTFLHVDGDSFFASCETSLNPRLKGMPIVTGHERGIATSMSKEAKALGITRGMPVYKIKKLFPQVLILHSNYSYYSVFAERMYAIVRRFTDHVEEYSIDECFADITGLERVEQSAKEIKDTLHRELDMTFSIGVAPTKVLAKVASKNRKPDGFTVIDRNSINAFLKDLPVGAVWGIGPSASHALQKLGVTTALDFIERPKDWVQAHFSKPLVEIWHELRGESLHDVQAEAGDDQKSIQMTRTFTPPSKDRSFLLSELSKNIEGACMKARSAKLVPRKIYFFLKTQEFRYHRSEILLESPVSLPNKIMHEVEKAFDQVWKKNVFYRATGVTLAELMPEKFVQNPLLPEKNRGGRDAWKKVFKTVDKLDRRYGTHTVVLGSSLKAFKRRNIRPHRRLKIPYMGEVA